MKKLITVFILVCLAIALVNAIALAQSDFEFNPFRWNPEDPVEVSASQNIIMDGGWFACRRGAVQMFLTASNISWALYEDESQINSGEDKNQYWSKPFSIPAGPGAEACMGKTPEMGWSSRWRYTLGQKTLSRKI